MKVTAEGYVNQGPPLQKENQMSKEEYTKMTLMKIDEAKDRYQKMALQNAPPIKEEDPRSVAEVNVSKQLERAYSQDAIVNKKRNYIQRFKLYFAN